MVVISGVGTNERKEKHIQISQVSCFNISSVQPKMSLKDAVVLQTTASDLEE